MVCGGATLTLTRPRTSTLQVGPTENPPPPPLPLFWFINLCQELLDHLGASPSYQLSRPSVSSQSLSNSMACKSILAMCRHATCLKRILQIRHMPKGVDCRDGCFGSG